MEEHKLHDSQQKRLDKIVDKYMDYMDTHYDNKETPKPEPKSQDIALPEKKKKKPKRPQYSDGKCIYPGCGAAFKRTSGIQKFCPEHKPVKYTPKAQRTDDSN